MGGLTRLADARGMRSPRPTKRFGGTTERAEEDFGKGRWGSTEGAKVASGMCKATLNASGTEARFAQWSTYPRRDSAKRGVAPVTEASFRFRSG